MEILLGAAKEMDYSCLLVDGKYSDAVATDFGYILTKER